MKLGRCVVGRVQRCVPYESTQLSTHYSGLHTPVAGVIPSQMSGSYYGKTIRMAAMPRFFSGIRRGPAEVEGAILSQGTGISFTQRFNKKLSSHMPNFVKTA